MQSALRSTKQVTKHAPAARVQRFVMLRSIKCNTRLVSGFVEISVHVVVVRSDSSARDLDAPSHIFQSISKIEIRRASGAAVCDLRPVVTKRVFHVKFQCRKELRFVKRIIGFQATSKAITLVGVKVCPA